MDDGELRLPLELLQTLHARKDKENCMHFYDLVFPGEAKICLGSMHFHTPHAALKQKNTYYSPNMQPIIRFFQGLFKFMKHHLLAIFSK